ncbi:MAG: hypothetical protein V3T83_21675 [Acidobacteriota bacterium]
MKKALLSLLFACIALSSFSLAGRGISQDEDLAAVMKVVQRAEASASSIPPRKEGQAKVIKLLIQHGKEGEKLSLSLPLSWVEWLLEMDEDRSLDTWTGDDEIKLKNVLEMLKSMGATELLEIRDKDSLIRIWLE